MFDSFKRLFNNQSDPNVIRLEYEILNRRWISANTWLKIINGMIVFFVFSASVPLVLFPLQWILGEKTVEEIFPEIFVMGMTDFVILIFSVACLWWLCGLRKAIAFNYTRWYITYSERNLKNFCYYLGYVIKKCVTFAIILIVIACFAKRYGILTDEIPALEPIVNFILETTDNVVLYVLAKIG